MAKAQIDPVFVVDQLEKLDHIVVVVEGLANAHEHNAVDALAAVLRGKKHLVEQLSGGEVAHQAADGRGAKAAPHAAPDLA